MIVRSATQGVWRWPLQENEDQALDLGRALRAAASPEVIKTLRYRATHGPTALARRAALLALEGREPDLWWEPVTRAFHDDLDPTVRQAAADFLARALADERYVAIHPTLRMTLVQGLTNLP